MKSKFFCAPFSLLFVCFLGFYGCSNQFSEYYSNGSSDLNGGFELESNGLPLNWQLYTQKAKAKGDFKLGINRLEKFEGNQSLEINVRSCSSEGGCLSPGFAKELTVATGKNYLIRFYTKSSPGTNWLFTASAITEKQHLLSVNSPSEDTIEKEKNELLITGVWKKNELQIELPKEATKLRLECNVRSKGVLFVDGMEILALN